MQVTTHDRALPAASEAIRASLVERPQSREAPLLRVLGADEAMTMLTPSAESREQP